MAILEKKTIRNDIPGHQALMTGASTPPQSMADMRRMVVPAGIGMQGSLSACDHLIVEGRVASHKMALRRLDIAEKGEVSGMIDVMDAVIAGTFSGTLVVRGRLTIKSTAVVDGDVQYASFAAENGSRIDARLSPISAMAAAASIHPDARGSLLSSITGINNVATLFSDRELQPKKARSAGKTKDGK